MACRCLKKGRKCSRKCMKATRAAIRRFLKQRRKRLRSCKKSCEGNENKKSCVIGCLKSKASSRKAKRKTSGRKARRRAKVGKRAVFFFRKCVGRRLKKGRKENEDRAGVKKCMKGTTKGCAFRGRKMACRCLRKGKKCSRGCMAFTKKALGRYFSEKIGKRAVFFFRKCVGRRLKKCRKENEDRAGVKKCMKGTTKGCAFRGRKMACRCLRKGKKCSRGCMAFTKKSARALLQREDWEACGFLLQEMRG